MRTIFALLLLFAVIAVPAAAADTYLCSGVVDGDTITLENGETVKLIGVDAPEISASTGAAEWYGAEAYWFVKRLVENKPVRLELGWPKKDKLDRTLAYVYLMDGTCVNVEIIVKGYGQVDRGDLFRYRRRYIGYEKVAKEYNKGLWNAEAKDYFEAREKLRRENPALYEAYVLGNVEASRRLGAFDKEPGKGHIELVEPGSGTVIYEPTSEGTGTTAPAASGESNSTSGKARGAYGIGAGTSAATASEDIVYIEDGGDTYHRGTCRLLTGNKIAIPKSEAIRRNLKPCPECKP
jgi:micrococcal nuclease